MKVADIMTPHVVSVAPDIPVDRLAALLIERHISAVPVTDDSGQVIGIASEGDLIRRVEIGTDRVRPARRRGSTGQDAKASGRTARDVMTRDVVTIGEDAPIAEAADLMERHRIKRLPVMRRGTLVGIISRANLVRALVMAAGTIPGGAGSDAAIRRKLLDEMQKPPWSSFRDLGATVGNGIVHLWGTVETPSQRTALGSLASRVAGAQKVENHVAVISRYWGDRASPETPRG